MHKSPFLQGDCTNFQLYSEATYLVNYVKHFNQFMALFQGVDNVVACKIFSTILEESAVT